MADQINMADQKQRGGPDNMIQDPKIDRSKPDTCTFKVGQEVNYTAPDNKVYTARILKINKMHNTSEIKYNPFPGTASDDRKHPEIDVNNSTLSCIPTATAVPIPDDVKGTIAIKDGKNVPTIANDSNASNLKNAEVVFTRPKVYPIATPYNPDNPTDNQDNPTDNPDNPTDFQYLLTSTDKENEFDINILRNEGNDGYKIQTITAKTQDNGKYNMVTLDLDIGSTTSDADRELMKSKISRAIGIVLSKDRGLSNVSIGTENNIMRDLTEVYNDENTNAAAPAVLSTAAADNLLGNISDPQDLANGLTLKPVKTANQVYTDAAINNDNISVQTDSTAVSTPMGQVNNPLHSVLQSDTQNDRIPDTVFNIKSKYLTSLSKNEGKNKVVNLKAMGIARGIERGGKLSRKRKRNMTKSKRRKVGTTRRRR